MSAFRTCLSCGVRDGHSQECRQQQPFLAIDKYFLAREETPPPAKQADYVLKVRGDSMAHEAILDGDFVILRCADTALPGELVVAEDGDAVGLRRYREGMSVLAVVTGLMRKF